MSEPPFSKTHRGSFVVLMLAAFVVVCTGIKLAAPVLIPLVLGGFIATVDVPLVLWLRRRRVPLGVAVLGALGADALTLGGLFWLFVGSLAGLSVQLPSYLMHLESVQERAAELLREYGITMPLREVVDPSSVVTFLASLAGDIAGLLTDLLLALIIAAFLLLRFSARTGSDGRLLSLRTESVRRAVRAMYRYMAVKTLTSIITGAFVGGWLWFVDADLPVLFALVTLLLNYVPTIGSTFAGFAIVALDLLQHGPEHAALVAAGYVVINIIIGNVVEPRVMGRALGLWPLIVLLSVVFWGFLLGVVGAVLSAVLTQTLKLLLLATPDLHAVGLSLGPKPKRVTVPAAPPDLVEEAMPPSLSRPRAS